MFGTEVTQNGCRNIHYRTNEKSLYSQFSDIPGWVANKDTKLTLLGEYRRATALGEYVLRDTDEVNEMYSFVYMENGSVAHSGSTSGIDPSGAKENHGDRVTASALCWLGMKGRPKLAKDELLQAPEGSFLWRRQQSERSADEFKDRWNGERQRGRELRW